VTVRHSDVTDDADGGDGEMKSEAGEERDVDAVVRGRQLHRLPQQPAVREKQSTRTGVHCAVRRHRRQRSVSLDA